MEPHPQQQEGPPSKRQHLSAASLKESESLRNNGIADASVVSSSSPGGPSSNSDTSSSGTASNNGSTEDSYSFCSNYGVGEDLPTKGLIATKKRAFTEGPSASAGNAPKPSIHRPAVAYRIDGKKLVEKYSLTEESLIEEKIRATIKCKNKGLTTEDDKRDERRAANRLSAFQSRQRRKIVIEDLQKTSASLSKDNASQRVEMSKLRSQVDVLEQENRELRTKLAAVRDGSHSIAGGTAVACATQQTVPSVASSNTSALPVSAMTNQNIFDSTTCRGHTNPVLELIAQMQQRQQQQHPQQFHPQVLAIQQGQQKPSLSIPQAPPASQQPLEQAPHNANFQLLHILTTLQQQQQQQQRQQQQQQQQQQQAALQVAGNDFLTQLHQQIAWMRGQKQQQPPQAQQQNSSNTPSQDSPGKPERKF